MTSNITKFIFSIIAILILFSSCREELTENISETSEDSNLKQSSVAATLILKTVMKDGSKDNVIDRANCFTIQLPVTVTVNNTTVDVNTIDDYETVEDLLNNNTDNIQISFPIKIILSDYTEETINNQNEFDSFKIKCNGDDENDDDIECVDFKYPFKVYVFNKGNDQSSVVTLENDKQTFHFIKKLKKEDITNIDFPITLALSDGSEVVITDLKDLENTINTFKDNCYENDNNNFDDDCFDCTTEQLENIFSSCTNWTVTKLKLNGATANGFFINSQLAFLTNGVVSASKGLISTNGTWSSSGLQGNIKLKINNLGFQFSALNGEWSLLEIKEKGGVKKIELKKVNGLRMRIETSCN